MVSGNADKLSEIQQGLLTLQDSMINEFSNVHKAIDSVDCKGRLSEYRNVIFVGFKELINYANETNPLIKQTHKQVLMESFFQVKAAVNYMIASLVSSSIADLSACPILDIVEKGDASTSFLVSSDSAIFTLGNLMLTDIIFGTSVIGSIYEM